MNDMGIPFEARTKFSKTWLLLYFSASTAYCCVMLMKLGFTAEQPAIMRKQQKDAVRANDLIVAYIRFSKKQIFQQIGVYVTIQGEK